MPDQRETLVRKMVEEGTSDDDILSTLKVYDVQHSLPARPVSAEDFAPDKDRPIWQASASLPGGTFAEKLKGAVSALGGEAIGALKGAAHSAIGIGEMAASGIPGMMPTGLPDPVFAHARAATAYGTDPAERFGGGMETAAELAAPAMDFAKGGLALAKTVPRVPSLALDAAEWLPVVGSPIHKTRKILSLILDNAATSAKSSANAGGRLVTSPSNSSAAESELAAMLEELRAPQRPNSVELPPPAELPPGYTPRTDAPAPVAVTPSANAGGRLAQPSPPPVKQAITDALTELQQPTQPARVTLPPPPDLPPGYTPRASVPKPKAAKMDAPKAEPDDAPRARAYFLKPQAVIDVENAAKEAHAARMASKATADIAVSDLPAAWQSRVGQDLFPVTGSEGKDMLAGLMDEMRTRGLTAGQAITAVVKNKTLPTQVRAQLIRALSMTPGAQ